MIRRLSQFFFFVGLCAACSAQTQSTAHAQAAWRTYRNADYGFTIDYPADMSFNSGHPLPPRQRSMIPVCDDTTVACFEYNGHAFDGTPVESLAVSINILRDETIEANCDDMDDVKHASKAAVIHGTLFHVAQTGGAAAGSFEGGTIYHVFHQHVCFEIALNEALDDIGAPQYKEAGLHAVNQSAHRAIQNQMQQMLESFAFVGPVRDGPAWRIYPDSESTCDGRFEVPIGAAVEEVNPSSSDGVYSSGVTCAVTFTDLGRLYLIAEAGDVHNSCDVDNWLAMSAFPGIAHARLLADGVREYKSFDRAYFWIRGELIVFAVSNPAGGSPPQRDRVFDHLVGSFRMP
jgi:hypothetical protein